MGWFRTAGGRLIHGDGGLADVYARRGWGEVSEEDALAEIASGEAQARADVEADLAKKVDEAQRRTDEAKTQKGPAAAVQAPAEPQEPTGGLTVHTDTPPLTVEDEAAVQKVLDEESPR